MTRRRAFLTAAILVLSAVVLLLISPLQSPQPDCKVIFLGITNTSVGRFMQFAISNSGPCAIEVGHYGTYWSGQRPAYKLFPPTMLINRLYESIPPSDRRVFTIKEPPSTAFGEEAGWRLEFVYRRAENRLQRGIRAGRTWLSRMWPGNFAAPTERRSVLSAVSDWIPEASETGQQTAAPNEDPAATPDNSDGQGGSSHR